MNNSYIMASTLKFKLPPKDVGYYLVGECFRFNMSRKPRWLTRIMMKLILEWTWIDL